MRILLVKPRWFVRGGQYRYLEHVHFSNLSLGILAALSEGHDVVAVDGDRQPILYDVDVDLVGITATTFTSERAFAIADRFRQRGVKVVLGGVHPSLMPDECLRHADAVVVGEAEYVWRTVLADAERGALAQRYQADRPTDMDDVPFPRRDVLGEPGWFACVQATRGCTNRCRYCYLPATPWSSYRKRSVDLVAQEVAGLKQKLVYFVDDNLFVDRDYVLKLLRAIAPLRKTWAIQAPTTIGDDPEVLDAMGASGCFNVQVGFQSFNPKSLDWAAVRQNRVEKYADLVAKLHARGIFVTAFFMFGFDTDGPDVFDATVEMARNIDVDDANCYVLTPYPGTDFHEQFRREGRLLEDRRRTQFGWSHAVFQPKQMTPEQLEQGVQRVYDQLYPFFRRKVMRSLVRRFPFFFRHPQLLRVVAAGSRRHARVATEPI